MMSPALLLQVVATFTFTNGAQITIGRDTTQANPVVLRISQGVRSATQRLSSITASHWAYEAAIASTIGTTGGALLAPDSLEGYSKTLSAFTTRVSCGRAGCRATIFSVTLWGSTYAYLRPGPLPLPEMLKLGEAIRQAAVIPNAVSRTSWPYSWRQP